MQITLVAGARPNFMKIAPIIRAIEVFQRQGNEIQYRLVHTGQHYDQAMSGSFFSELNIPEPHINLECGGGTQAEQTAAILVRFEQELLSNRPDLVLVVGDVTSTMACTITAKKCGVDVAHVEAGIRSNDMTMPEEINRMVTDSIADWFFTTTEAASQQLIRCGIDASRIHFVGNTMIDTLMQQMSHFKKPDILDTVLAKQSTYFLLTLHRPSNVDDASKLKQILDTILLSNRGVPVLFPVHPRTKKNLETIGYENPDLIITNPQPYLHFMYLIQHSKGVITDSGGITEETTVLNIPCLTLRNSTERPETISMGTNELIGDDYDKLSECIQSILDGSWKSGKIPPLWDGHTAERIIRVIHEHYNPKAVRS